MSQKMGTDQELRAEFVSVGAGAPGLEIKPDSEELAEGSLQGAALAQHLESKTGLTAAQVYVRSMWLVSDQINSFGGVIPREQHEQLARLLIDAPVLVGHRTDTLPIGRVFATELTERGGVAWVKGIFYWLREADGAENLRANIDGGIYRECSISFLFQTQRCLLCGEEVQNCPHEPNRVYKINGRRQRASFRYEGITKVLECSLVYRGAMPDTLVTAAAQTQKQPRSIHRHTITSLAELPVTGTAGAEPWYLVTPRYEGIRVMASIAGNELTFSPAEPGGTALPESSDRFAIRSCASPLLDWPGLLVGYRHRSRVPAALLEKALAGESTELTKVVLYLKPTKERCELPVSADPRLEIWLMPYASMHRSELASRVDTLASRDGVELWPWSSDDADAAVIHYLPEKRQNDAAGISAAALHNRRAVALHFNSRESAWLMSGKCLLTELGEATDPRTVTLFREGNAEIPASQTGWYQVIRQRQKRWGVRLFGSTCHEQPSAGAHEVRR